MVVSRLLLSLLLITPTTNFVAGFGCFHERYLGARSPLLLPSHQNQRQSFVSYASEQNRRNDEISQEELAALEKQVIASAHSRVDFDRIMRALQEDDTLATPIRNDLMYEDEDLARAPAATSHWEIAVAAASVTSGLSFVIFHNYYISVFVCGFVFVAALVNDDSLSGAVARVVGRSTIQSVQASQPKIKALARAVVTGEEEIVSLKRRVQELEEENASLRLWKDRRIKIDAALSRYTADELKATARENGLPIGGTKYESLIRLVEADVIRLP